MGSSRSKLLSYSCVISLFLFSALAWGADFDPEIVKDMFNEAASNQIAQAGFFFSVAAWLHGGRVKKEIKSNFEGLTLAINNLSNTLREDLKTHAEILKKHTGAIDNLSTRVQNLENKNS